jgi:hypothetical protein
MKWKPTLKRRSDRKVSRLLSRIAISLFALFLLNVNAQEPNFDSQSGPRRAEFVAFLASEPVNVAAGKAAIVPLHFRVADGMHINSHTPHLKELIPTQLAVAEIPGINVVSVDFPAGSDYSFAFSPRQKLSVYAGELVLRAHLIARPGDHPVHALLRYQACDSTSCYPPKTLSLSFEVIAK